MKALQSLTELFIRQVTDAKNVELWAEDGELKANPSDVIDGFDLLYTVHIALSQVEMAPEMLMMHLLNWLNRYDIDRADKGLSEPTFATQLLDKSRCDVKIVLEIKETYRLEPSPTGMWQRDGERFDCVSEFGAVEEWEDMDFLRYVGGHENDLP